MTDETLADAVAAQKRTELDRLGADKALLAFTEAHLDTTAVLGSLAAREAGLRDVYADWADDADGEAATAYADAAERAGHRYDRLADGLESVTGGSDALVEHLRGLSGSERAGGLVAAGLVADRTYLQAINFFVNEADERRASLCRDLRADAGDDGEAGERALAALGDDRDRVLAAATGAIDAAYGQYVDRLEGMGLDPKPVC
ncbi:MAG: transcription antitermination protein [Haloarculaceae archaeon]